MRELGTSPFARLIRRIDRLVRRRSFEARLNGEIREHLESEAADRVARGMPPDDAWRSAVRDFGGVERHKEEARDARGLRWLEESARDGTHALRVLRRNPGFSIAVALTMALGIGCTTAVFTLVYGILMRPLPYSDPSSLVTLWERNDARGGTPNVSSDATFEAWRDRTRSFSAVAALVPAPLTLDGQPSERLKGVQVSSVYFRMLGVRPSLGRDFAPADEANGGAPVAILSDALWKRRYGGDRSLVGRTISIDGRAVTVIGIMSADFDPPRFGWIADQPLWIPFAPTDDNRKWGRFLHVVARTRDGVSSSAATAELSVLSARLSAEHEDDKGWSSMIVPLSEEIIGDVRTPIIVLFSAVALLLAMSAVNVASLVSAFAAARRHEVVVRRTMGATVSRLIRQQLAQSLVLGFVGAVLGVMVAIVATRAIAALLPASIPRLENIRVDRTVLAFAAALSLVTALTFGLVGALRAIHVTNATPRSMGSAGARVTARLGGSWIVAAEMCLGLVLTVLAVLMIRSFDNLRSVNLGFDVAHVVSGRLSLPNSSYDSDSRRSEFFDALLARLRVTPGIASASIVTSRPFACCAPTTPVRDPSRIESIETSPVTDVRYADDAYFATMRIPLLAGRAFSKDESASGEVRTVVSRSLAHALWGDESPIGKTISMPVFGTTIARVIGVVGDVHLVDPRTPSRPTAYISTRRFPSSERDVVVRGDLDDDGLLAALRSSAAAIDPHIPVYMTTTFEKSVSETLARDRATTGLLGAFAALSLVLAGVGVYGVLAGDVGRRRKEIGIRIALGARAGQVARLVLRRVLRPAVSGAVVGVVIALALAKLLSAMVFGIAPWDPLSYAIVFASLIVIAVVATTLPAIRAARIPPIETIRSD